ncbi:MAG: DEAD/DEAH box helicase [Candidatus Aenigmatarchaeota archaeon]
MKFEDLNIENSVLASLNNIGFKEPTQIQAETIPLIKQGHDVIGQSQTGSGKTAAFGIPMVEKVEKGGKIQALVLSPTRELTIQTAGELEKFSKHKGLYVQTIYGGVSFGPQLRGLEKAEIIVGTPGRVLDHIRRGNLKLDKIKMFVLDEADKMIDMGFAEDIEDIERGMPKNKQNLLFCATMPERLENMKRRFTRNAVDVKTKLKVDEDMLKQFYCNADRRSKFSLLVHLINQEDPNLSMIFCNSRRETDMVARNLKNNKIKATALHGGLTQARRESIIDGFHKGKINIVVATDVASRGLDIKNVTHIFNYNIPKDAESFTNRIGRTARAGEEGKAISLLSREDHESFRRIVSQFSYDITKLDIQNFKMLPFDIGRDSRNRDSRGGGPRRGFGGPRSSGGSRGGSRRRSGSSTPRDSKLFKPKW